MLLELLAAVGAAVEEKTDQNRQTEADQADVQERLALQNTAQGKQDNRQNPEKKHQQPRLSQCHLHGRGSRSSLRPAR